MKQFLLLFLLLSNVVLAQRKMTPSKVWNLIVADSISNKGTEKATVMLGKKKYLVTNIDGTIIVAINDIDFDYGIKISSVGYTSKSLSRLLLNQFPDTIRLGRSLTILKEVKVNFLKPIEIAPGSFSRPASTHMQPDIEIEAAQYIPNQKKITGFISSVSFELNNDAHSIEEPFNVEILAKVNGSIYPDTALLKDSVIVYNSKKEKRLTVDISKYHIRVPENGFFVVFQTLPQNYYSKEKVWYYGRYAFKVPGINIYLKKKNEFTGYCCPENEPPDRTGFYCLSSGDRNSKLFLPKTKQWIVYEDGINFGISATVDAVK